MAATYEALCEEGYSELTAQSIADRTDKSKSALFYHYDSKEELLADFIRYLLEGFERRAAAIDDQPPVERLAAFVDWSLSVPPVDEAGYHTAMLELRAQAPYNEIYRKQLRESDALLRDALVDVLEDGIETGDFREHDTAEVAELLLAAFDGARIRRLTLDRTAYIDAVRSGVIERVLEDVLASETAYPDEPARSFPPDERLVGEEPNAADDPASDLEPEPDARTDARGGRTE